jgi:hypothetical protein
MNIHRYFKRFLKLCRKLIILPKQFLVQNYKKLFIQESIFIPNSDAYQLDIRDAQGCLPFYSYQNRPQGP